MQKRKRNSTTALLVAMVLLLGALVARVVSQNPNRRLLADLPVIQHVDVYSQFDSIDFLRQLDQEFAGMPEPSDAEQEDLTARLNAFQQVSNDGERQAWLDSLADDEKITLRAKFNRFRNLSGDKQAKLRQLHDQIDSADERGQLVTTMFRYQRWLNELQPSEQADYRELSDMDQASKVAKEMKRAARDQTFELTHDQLETLFAEVGPFVRRVMQDRKPALERELRRMSRRENWDFDSMPRSEQLRRVFPFVMRAVPEQMSELNEVIVGVLPVEVGQAFEQLNARHKADRMRAWAWEFHKLNVAQREGATSGSVEVSEEVLADFFVDELTNAEREELLALPREQMREQLLLKLRGKMSQGDRRGSRNWDRPPLHPEDRPPFDRLPRGRRDDERWQRGDGPPRGRRGGPGFDGGPPARRPREFDRDGPRRRRPAEGPPPPSESGE